MEQCSAAERKEAPTHAASWMGFDLRSGRGPSLKATRPRSPCVPPATVVEPTETADTLVVGGLGRHSGMERGLPNA